jgi:hypothetical protein
VEELRTLIAGRDDRLGFAGDLSRVKKRHGLDIEDFGAVLAEATAADDLAAADRVLWTDIAICAEGYVDDLYQIVREVELAILCGGFLRVRMRLAPDRDRALAEAAELVRVWVIRLTGYPLLYDYFDEDRLHAFAGFLLGDVRAGWVAIGGEDPDRVIRELVARLVPQVRENYGPTLDAARLVTAASP